MLGKLMSKNEIWENLKQVLYALIIAVFMMESVVATYKIPSSSMEDTLLVGDFLVANKFVYGARIPFVDYRLPEISDPQQGDVVIFIPPHENRKYIKRCIAVGGDTLEIINRKVLVNGIEYKLPEHGKFLNSKIIPRKPDGSGSFDNFGPIVVPKDNFFMMGDNRDNSLDSRAWGFAHKDNILGEAIFIHWSWSDEEYPSPDVIISDPLSLPRMFIYNAVHFVDKVQWSRLFTIIR